MMIETTWLLAAVAVVGGGLLFDAAQWWWQAARQRAIAQLRQWERETGHQILELEPRYVFQGPFTLQATSAQPVYRATVRTKTGLDSIYWLQCGDPALGLARRLTAHLDSERAYS